MHYAYDHFAYRTLEREKAVRFFCNALGYKEVTEFEIFFNEEKNDKAICSVLEPSDRVKTAKLLPFIHLVPVGEEFQPYVMAPEIFISSGSPGSIVHNWVLKRGNACFLHHIALRVSEESTVEKEMQIWKENGWCDGFTSEEPFKCDEMSQVFTKENLVLGIIFELIKRKEQGFCQKSVLSLINSTRDLSI